MRAGSLPPRRRRTGRLAAGGAALLLAWGAVTAAATPQSAAVDAEDLHELSIEDLMSVEVTSVSKRPERLEEAAAAIFVLTGEEIRRSGAVHIADVLRLVPGISVARSQNHAWAISSRGFTSTIANKLEVLMDGRSLYTPLFSGVFWDVQDTFLEDIDRIEVIRGPGATLWGGNAVNGVINILTKSAAETQGTAVSAIVGTEKPGIVGARYGGRTRGGTAFRLYGKYLEKSPSELAEGGEAFDAWEMGRLGFRTDETPLWGGSLTLQGDAYASRAESDNSVAGLSVPVADDLDAEGLNVIGRWQRTEEEPSGASRETQVQAYYDQRSRDIPSVFGEMRHIFDLELQRRRRVGDNELVWGATYRFNTDDITNTDVIFWQPRNRELHYFGAFLQDEARFFDRRLRLTVGSKFEHNDFTGFEVQPNVRLLFDPRSSGPTVWGAVSRAVRSPNRLDHDVRFAASFSNDPPTDFVLMGSPSFEPEELIAYELGLRASALGEALLFDITAFYNDYDRLGAIVGPGEPRVADGRIIVPFSLANRAEGRAHGFEVVTAWQPRPGWRIDGSWSYLDIEIEGLPAAGDITASPLDTGGSDPHHKVVLRSYFDGWRRWEIDGVLRYVSALEGIDVDSYLELDLHLARRITDRLSLALVGRNLLDDRHLEFNAPATAVERSLYVHALWKSGTAER